MFNTKNSQRSQPLSVHDYRIAQALALAILTIKALPERQRKAVSHQMETELEALLRLWSQGHSDHFLDGARRQG